MKFLDNVGDSCILKRLCSIVYVTFRSQDIRH